MDFVTSPRIAHAVKKITMLPRVRSDATPYSKVPLSNHNPLIVRRLCDLPSLSTVVCEKIIWSVQLCDDLAATISQLDTLEVKDSVVSMDASHVVATRLKVKNLTIEATNVRQYSTGRWSSVIEAAHTNYIVGELTTSCLEDLQLYDCPGSLRGLKTRVRASDIQRVVEVLHQHKSTLHTLWLALTEESTMPSFLKFNWPVMPMLGSYCGSLELLSVLLSTAGSLGNMNYLHLHDSWRNHSDSVALINIFRGTSKSILDTLIFTTSDISEQLLATISECHPLLRHLTIKSSEGFGTSNIGFDVEVRIICVTLNQCLIRIHLSAIIRRLLLYC